MPHPRACRAPLSSIAVVLALLLVGCASPADRDVEATVIPTAVLGEVGGAVTTDEPEPSVAPSSSLSTGPTPAPSAAPTSTPAPTPAPQADGFAAVVRACDSISGASCNGEYGTMPAGRDRFTALVTFTGANAGDTIGVVLAGPSGTFPGGPYTLQGGGDGYYYSVFAVPNLAPGTYTLTASRNGAEVAATTFTKEG